MAIVNPPLPVDAPVADILTRAADLLRVNGLHVANPPDYWDGASHIPWEPGMAPDPLGAIGVAIGARTGIDVTRLLGSSPLAPGEQWPRLHPAPAAVFAYLGYTGRADEQVERFFAWCDRQFCHDVIRTYRECAAKLRAGAVAA